MRVRRRPSILIAVAAFALPLSVVTATSSPAADGSPWWCDPGSVLLETSLPDVLPVSACALDGRVVTGAAGHGVQVPPAGTGVAATAGDETLVVWSDEYGTHVRGDQYAVSLGYVGTLRAYLDSGAGSAEDVARMARALQRLATESVGRVRPLPMPVAVLLDAADAVAAAFDGSAVPPFGVAVALDTLEAYYRVQALPRESDDLPSLTDLAAMTEDLRASLRAQVVDAATADRMLGTTVMLRNYLAGEPADAAGVTAMLAGLGTLTTDQRAVFGGGPGVAWVAPFEGRDYDALLADVMEYLATEIDPGLVPGVVPWTQGPSMVDPTGMMAGGSPPACSDGARAALFPEKTHWRRGTAAQWRYNNSGRYPVYLAADYADALKTSFDNITSLFNDCGYRWHPNLFNQYLGYATHTGPNIRSGVCKDPDAYSIVGWSSFVTSKDGILALACVWRNATEITTADVTMNNSMWWDIPEVNPYYYEWCEPYAPAPEVDLESVMTHEFGHVAGLGHVAESTHGNLTMSETINEYCGISERTLGYGDAIGLGNLYGKLY